MGWKERTLALLTKDKLPLRPPSLSIRKAWYQFIMSEEYLFWLYHFPFFLEIINWRDKGGGSVETCSLCTKQTFTTRMNQIWSDGRIITTGPYTCWKSLILMKVYFSIVMVKSRKQFPWIEEITHPKQGLFLYQEDQQPSTSPVSEQKYQKDNGRPEPLGLGTGW